MEQGASERKTGSTSSLDSIDREIKRLNTSFHADTSRAKKDENQSVTEYLNSLHEIQNPNENVASDNSNDTDNSEHKSESQTSEKSERSEGDKKSRIKSRREKNSSSGGTPELIESEDSPSSDKGVATEPPSGASENNSESESSQTKTQLPRVKKRKPKQKRERSGSEVSKTSTKSSESADEKKLESDNEDNSGSDRENRDAENSDTEKPSAQKLIKPSFPTRTRPKKPRSLWRQILGRGKTEMAALGSLFFMAASMLLQIHGKVKVERLIQRAAPKPVPLFGPHSLVDDHYTGTGADVHGVLSNAEVTLIAYYAPWCAQCQVLRWQLDQLSRHFPPNQVKFLAVNCWDPGGRCKQLYRMYTFPVLAVYPASAQAVFYNGPFTADYLYRFLTSVLNPLERLNTQQEIVDFMMSTDVCVIAFFDFGTYEEPPGYKNYQAAAVRALERDPQRWVRFGVVTNRELAYRALQMDSNKQTHLYSLTSDRFHSYPYRNRSYKAVEIVKWIFGQFETWRENKPLGYWLPTGEAFGHKSEQLGSILSSGPTAILFTPREPLWEDLGPSKVYAAFRETAQHYWECQDRDNPTLKSRLAGARKETRKRQLDRQGKMQSLPEDCRALARRQKQLKDCCHDVVLTTVTVAPHRNICDFCSPVAPKVPLTYLGKSKKNEVSDPSTTDKLPEELPQIPRNPDATASLLKSAIHIHSCHGFDGVVPAPSLVKYCCHTPGDLSSENSESDRISNQQNSLPEELPLAQTRRFASLLNEGSRSHTFCGDTTTCSRAESDANQPSRELIDSCLQLRLSKTLGYAPAPKPHHSSPVRKNGKVERNPNSSHSNLGKESADPESGEAIATQVSGLGCVSNRSLTFIAVDSRSYSWLRTKIIGTTAAANLSVSDSTLVIVQNSSESIYWHRNPSPNSAEISDFIRAFNDNYLNEHKRDSPAEDKTAKTPKAEGKSSAQKQDDDDSLISLKKVNRENFEEIVLDDKKDVVLVYTGGKWCGFCQGVYHVMLTAVAFFRGLEDRLIFAQVDTTQNDLDIPYMVDRFPSIILYPSKRKSNSVAFPSFLPLTLPNLLSFVLANAHPEIRWRVAFGNCGSRCSASNRLEAILRLQTLRTEIRILKSRMAGVFSSSTTWSEPIYWGEEKTNMGAVYALLLRKELAKKEVQRRTLRSLLRLSHSLGQARDLLNLKTEGEKAALLEWVIKNNDWLSLSTFARQNGSQRLLIR